VHKGEIKEETVASSARNKESTNRSKVEIIMSARPGARWERMRARRRGGEGRESGTEDISGHSIIGKTNWCRRMQAAVSRRLDEE
jgi:hypothetical protein